MGGLLCLPKSAHLFSQQVTPEPAMCKYWQLFQEPGEQQWPRRTKINALNELMHYRERRWRVGRGIPGRLIEELSMGRHVYRASGVWLCPAWGTQSQKEAIYTSAGMHLQDIQSSAKRSKLDIQCDPLLLMYVCTPMKHNRKAHSKLLTLPRTDALHSYRQSEAHFYTHMHTHRRYSRGNG